MFFHWSSEDLWWLFWITAFLWVHGSMVSYLRKTKDWNYWLVLPFWLCIQQKSRRRPQGLGKDGKWSHTASIGKSTESRAKCICRSVVNDNGSRFIIWRVVVGSIAISRGWPKPWHHRISPADHDSLNSNQLRRRKAHHSAKCRLLKLMTRKL